MTETSLAPTRRTVVRAGIASAAVFTLGKGTRAFAADRALREVTKRAVSVSGTTLQRAAAPLRASGYTRLGAGPGYALVVRDDLAKGLAGRDGRREAKASFVQFTDLHMLDAQSPMRFEWLHDITGSAFRPQEALGTQGAVSLVQRINQLARGPFTGRVFDAVVTTGDNTDNCEDIELDWFLSVMSGGTIVANTGDSKRWEGVQTSNTKNYYNPENQGADRYKDKGFLALPGYFQRATRAHLSPGLKTPWYSVFGNHDDSVQGTLPASWKALQDAYVGDQKFIGFSDPIADKALRQAVRTGSNNFPGANPIPDLTTRVTADERRRPFTPKEFMGRHFDPRYVGSGPVGHGFTQENLDSGAGYYAFEIAPGVTGIAMDSTNHAGFTQGSIGDTQWNWLKKRLRAGSSRYWDWGIRYDHDVSDELFILLSHHTSGSMGNLLLDPSKPELRHAGFELLRMLHDFPNVVAWVNGHTHRNECIAQGHADPKRAFWEVNTASHIDFPQQARVLELVDNVDGTLSLFGTLVEAASPYAAAYDSGAPSALASLYRELSYNDLHADHAQLGSPGDRNVELLLPHPWA